MLPKNAHYQFMYGLQNRTCAPVDSLKSVTCVPQKLSTDTQFSKIKSNF